ncbi:hypothetical protein, partial [Duganella margarita]|uniref:hypothetical protein n=1 Tax=Duganella margarita TaxID=2692170 RepID=UPI001E32F3F2
AASARQLSPRAALPPRASRQQPAARKPLAPASLSMRHPGRRQQHRDSLLRQLLGNRETNAFVAPVTSATRPFSYSMVFPLW